MRHRAPTQATTTHTTTTTILCTSGPVLAWDDSRIHIFGRLIGAFPDEDPLPTPPVTFALRVIAAALSRTHERFSGLESVAKVRYNPLF